MNRLLKYTKIFLIAVFCISLSLFVVGCSSECDHEYGEWSVSRPATCSEFGSKTKTCSKCGDTESESIEKLAHTTGTKFNMEKHWAECTVCGASLGNEINHNVVNYECECGYGVGQVLFELSANGNSYEVSGFLAPQNDVAVEIPAIYNGKPVTKVKADAFKEKNSVVSLTVPDSVLEIEKGAFEGCEKVVNLTLPFVGGNREGVDPAFISGTFHELNHIFGGDALVNKVPKTIVSIEVTDAERIRGLSFKNCTSLQKVKLNEGLKAISGSAFVDCVALNEVYIPDSIEEVGYNAFGDCKNTLFNTVGGVYYLGNGQNNYLVAIDWLPGGEDVQIKEGCKVIAGRAFRGCSTKNIVVPQSVLFIGEGAFKESKVENITISSGITTLHTETFDSASSLKTVNFAENSQLKTIENGCFRFNTALESINLPNGLETIGGGNFINTALKSITIPDSVKVIGDNAFSRCNSLVDINISWDSQLETIGENVFAESDKIEKFYITKNVVSVGNMLLYSCDKAKIFIAPESQLEASDINAPFSAGVYTYTEQKPESGKWWHFVDGNVTIWYTPF